MMAEGSAPLSCCSLPPADKGLEVGVASPAPSPKEGRSTRLLIPGGMAQVGTANPIHACDGESPVRHVRLAPFQMDETSVTNARFAGFISATGYVTEAERFGWSFVFFDMLPAAQDTPWVVGMQWWRRVDGAFWAQPEGPGSSMAGREDHPVTHVSWNDATVFARWAGGRLPSEAEWEHAARGGLGNVTYPWGDRAPDDDTFMPCNIWQGEFPKTNHAADGFQWLAPARSFTPNGFGLYNMSGNCWEWTADAWRIRSLKRSAKAQNLEAAKADLKVMKGGSFLCHASYCHRYRIAARHSNAPDTSTSHIGFRLAYDAPGV